MILLVYNFIIYILKNIFFIFFVKVNFIKVLVGFVFMFYRFVVNVLFFYVMFFGNNFGKENSYIIIYDFIVFR